jgi:hypothetical protein
VLLSELVASARRVALVGLAKNTGKTTALSTIVRELEQRGRRVGVTSVGRDGEERDVIDIRIAKPRVTLCEGSLVASTDALLRASGVAYEQLRDTGVRTPLGRVLIVRLRAAGAVEIAGPSAVQDVRAVADAMLAHGAAQVLVDGAIDRRAASSPAVCDALVMSTGAALHERIEQVVARTRDAVELVCLPELHDPRVRALADRHPGSSFLVAGPAAEPLVLPPRFVLSSSEQDIAQLLSAHPAASHLVVRGALHEPFLQGLLSAVRGRAPELVVADSTKVFLADRGCEWYRRRGLAIHVLTPIDLRAVTVNPLAPRSHSFDSLHLRSLLAEAIPGVPVLDVCDPSYGLQPAA